MEILKLFWNYASRNKNIDFLGKKQKLNKRRGDEVGEGGVYSRPKSIMMYHVTNGVYFLVPKILNLLPNKLKNIDSLKVFKNRTKN